MAGGVGDGVGGAVGAVGVADGEGGGGGVEGAGVTVGIADGVGVGGGVATGERPGGALGVGATVGVAAGGGGSAGADGPPPHAANSAAISATRPTRHGITPTEPV